ncbi:hypothetical protein PIB30_004995 [Stylosanthes scabra]|uniref:Uncharacterized protein n=1 Tax=Stylosanthes scabra TaxID=79078 RepID=A0ABU6Y5J5_9FABA|nr:hypothetical protein [Stylosanthes scabra]
MNELGQPSELMRGEQSCIMNRAIGSWMPYSQILDSKQAEKRARTRAAAQEAARAAAERELTPFSDVIYDSHEHYERSKLMRTKKVLKERILQIPGKGRDFMIQRIHQLGWEYMYNDLVDINVTIVKEFYSNFSKSTQRTIYLRGTQINIDEDSMTRSLGAGTFVRCSLESPLSLATKISSRTRVVLLSERKRKSVFDWGWLQLSLFRVQLTFGAGVAWSSCLNPLLPRVTCCHWYNPAVTRTSCALAKYEASDLCPGLTNSIRSPLPPGQTYCHQVPKHLCHAAVANLVRSRNCHYASRGVGRIDLRD